ncbi:MAG: glycosyltransferase [Isosphaeraceae bacterium]
MVVVHLVASSFVGGPEAQVLGLIGHLDGGSRSAVLSFAEGGRCQALLEAARQLGAEALELRANAPSYRAAAREVAGHLRRLGADVLCCHGYKPDILGLVAARLAGVPVVSVSHGWTAATLKVRLNEAVDRLCLRGMDRVVCVSEAQARKVRRAGVQAPRVVVIPNAIDPSRFDVVDPSGRGDLLSMFPKRPRLVVGTAGRLSPEKGYKLLIDAAAAVVGEHPDISFIHFGDGPLRRPLGQRIADLGLAERFLLAGFRTDLHRVLPHLDLFVLPSYTEGLPVVVLEAFASGLPVVATAVGGTPEVVEDGFNGRLVPPGDTRALAQRINELLHDSSGRRFMGDHGRALVADRFTFQAQALRYQMLFQGLRAPRPGDSRLSMVAARS